MSQLIQRVSTCCFVSGSVRRQGSEEVTNPSERRRAVQADSQVAQWRKDRWMRKGSAVSKTSRSAARVTFAWSDNSGPYPRRGAARAPATVRARRAGSAKTDSTNSLSSATSMPGGKHESCQYGSLKTRFTGKQRIQRCSELASRPPIATAQRPVSSQSRSTMAVLPLSSGRERSPWSSAQAPGRRIKSLFAQPDGVSATGRGAHIGSAERTAIATGAAANGNTVQPEAGTAAATACVGTSAACPSKALTAAEASTVHIHTYTHTHTQTHTHTHTH